MIEPDLEDLLASSYWVCDKCETPFATKELAEKHELKCDIKEDVENIEKILEKTEKVPDVEADSSMKELEKLIKRRNAGEVTSEEFEEMKKEILERKPQISKEPVEVAQKEISGKYDSIWSGLLHGDDVPKKENKDSVISKSSIGAGGKSKGEQIKVIKDLLDSGAIDDDEFKQMKKEILGK